MEANYLRLVTAPLPLVDEECRFSSTIPDDGSDEALRRRAWKLVGHRRDYPHSGGPEAEDREWSAADAVLRGQASPYDRQTITEGLMELDIDRGPTPGDVAGRYPHRMHVDELVRWSTEAREALWRAHYLEQAEADDRRTRHWRVARAARDERLAWADAAARDEAFDRLRRDAAA